MLTIEITNIYYMVLLPFDNNQITTLYRSWSD